MDWDAIPSDEIIRSTADVLQKRGFQAVIVGTRTEALEKLKELIPADASVTTGSSTTLDEIGFTRYLVSGKHPYRNLKEAIVAEKDPQKQGELRRQSILADYFLGSVQALAQTGESVSCDATGTRTGPYAYGPRKVIWVLGVNKIVKDLELALRRMREHCVPLEDQRMKKAGYPGTTLSRILIYEQCTPPNRITAVLIKEKLGF